MTRKRCIVFDIDGTLANCSHRVHHVNSKKKDWVAFMKGIPDDIPNEQVVWLNHLIKRDPYTGPIFLCSGRSENERIDTVEWLRKHGVFYDRMFMRKAGDYRADHIIKRELLEDIRAEGYEPFIIFDDRQCVVDMWRKEGLFVLQCDPKPSHTDHVGFEFHESIKWPLSIMVGPSGAGKTTWIKENITASNAHILTSDGIREFLTGDLRDQSKNEQVFATLHELATTSLRRGIPVIIDATNLKNADRLAVAKLVPERVPIRYIVIDRPLAYKKATAGWRAEVSVKGKTLVEYHDQVFKSNLKDIMRGDGLPNVTVQDHRMLLHATTKTF
jgi:predicted kinase